MRRSDYLFIIKSFLIWRIGLIVILFFAIRFLPNQANFLGGGLGNYLDNPYLWAWANFDGEHYLSIAQRGYGFGEEPFFPFYPLVIRILGGGIEFGLIVSHLSLLVALVGLYKLIRLDYSAKIAKTTIILLLIFPTSFYFGSVYTESLFLALTVWFFYALKKREMAKIFILGTLASGTKLIGSIFLVPFGLLGYMYYLQKTVGDPLAFVHNITIFGEQRSSIPILLPQVFYRYFFKIFPNLNYSYFPVVFTTFIELSVAIAFLMLVVISFKKLKLSYSLYLAFGYLIPTLSGSFSSLPRYVLVLFPAFMLTAMWVVKQSAVVRFLVYALLVTGLIISTAMFTRGYWLA